MLLMPQPLNQPASNTSMALRHTVAMRGIARAVSVFVIDPVSLMVFVLSESSRLSERIDPDRQRLLPFFCLQGRQQPLFVAAA